MSKDFIYLKVNKCRPHEGSDMLNIVDLRQGTVVTTKDVTLGCQAFYMPAGAKPPRWLSDALGITHYLNDGRISNIKLRGVRSFGALFSATRIARLAKENKWQFKETSKCPYERLIAKHLLSDGSKVRAAPSGKFALLAMTDSEEDDV